MVGKLFGIVIGVTLVGTLAAITVYGPNSGNSNSHSPISGNQASVELEPATLFATAQRLVKMEVANDLELPESLSATRFSEPEFNDDQSMFSFRMLGKAKNAFGGTTEVCYFAILDNNGQIVELLNERNGEHRIRIQDAKLEFGFEEFMSSENLGTY